MNEEKIKKLKEAFETCMLIQLGDGVKHLFDSFDMKNGYKDEFINGVWFGFCMGVNV